MSARTCACACGKNLDGRREHVIYFDRRCKQKAHRARLKALADELGVSAVLTIKQAQMLRDTRTGNGDRPSAAQAPRKRHEYQPQISYRKVRAKYGPGADELLTDAQRARLRQNNTESRGAP